MACRWFGSVCIHGLVSLTLCLFWFQILSIVEMRYALHADFSIFSSFDMTLHDWLPVYKITYDFLLAIFTFSKTFTREYKYTIWQELKNETISLMLDIYRANSSRSKRTDLLESAREKLETIRLMLRLTKDLRQISLDEFVSLHEKIENISKQLVWWQKMSERKI